MTTRSLYKYECVMLVDDIDLDNFVSETTIKINYFSKKIYVKTDAISALNLLNDLAKDTSSPFPEVIFIDINMPMINGFEFITSLKKNMNSRSKGHKPKLVLLTSSIFKHDQQKAKEAFDEIIYLVKPLTKEALKLI